MFINYFYSTHVHFGPCSTSEALGGVILDLEVGWKEGRDVKQQRKRWDWRVRGGQKCNQIQFHRPPEAWLVVHPFPYSLHLCVFVFLQWQFHSLRSHPTSPKIFYLFILIHTQGYVDWFEREKHVDWLERKGETERETSISFLPYVPQRKLGVLTTKTRKEWMLNR